MKFTIERGGNSREQRQCLYTVRLHKSKFLHVVQTLVNINVKEFHPI